ncbi:MAG: family 78 glycoside hydrolase catalytic domain [Niabella sp.]
MKNRVVFLLMMLLLCVTVFGQDVMVLNLRCAYRTNPLGVDDSLPVLGWELQSPRQNLLQSAYRILVADDLSLLKKNTGNIWDSKKVNSNSSVSITYGGHPLQSAKKYYWKVMVWDEKDKASTYSSPAYWQMGLLNKEDWKTAKWIGYDVMPDSNRIVPFAHGKGSKQWGERPDILPMFRRPFNISKPVKSATVYISGLGHFEMSLNGKKVGDHFLDPGWTQYDKSAMYVSFDITDQLSVGENVIGVELGNGFYYIPGGSRYRKLTGAYGFPKMIALVNIVYVDSTTETIITDNTWKTAPSPTYFTSIYGGEEYDANLEQTGWNNKGFISKGWKKAIITTGPPQLNSQMFEPVKIHERFEPVTKKELTPGIWIYDLGQNFSGIPSVAVKGKKGDTVIVKVSELINEDGSANQKGTGGPYYYKYILKGDGIEKWQPKFTFYGFRYIQVEGAVPESAANKENLPVLKSVKGLHIRAAVNVVGRFTSSSNLFNRTDELINWAIKSNMVSVFTDCPHREKLGWLEEAHLMGSSVQYNYDIAALGKKIIKDMVEAQDADGLIPDIAPEYVQFDGGFRDSPEWGSAGIIFPWYLYQWYNDKEYLIMAYDMMKRYIEYLKSKSTDYIVEHGLGDWFDIGPNRPGVSQLTPLGVTATATYYYDLTIMQKIATILNKQEDAQAYEAAALNVKNAFNQKYYNDTLKSYATGSQASNAMALYMNLVEPQNRQGVLESLIKDIRNRNNALTAGDVGYRYVLRALENAGRSDVIFDMNSRDDVPGYGYQLKHGATALTESWQAYPNVSNNHFMLGHLMEWFYSGLCGIKQKEGSVGFKEIEIRPQIVGDITHAKASYHSVHGLITVEWKLVDDSLELKVAVPANTTATVYFPKGYQKDPVKVGSGAYRFVVGYGEPVEP